MPAPSLFEQITNAIAHLTAALPELEKNLMATNLGELQRSFAAAALTHQLQALHILQDVKDKMTIPT